MVLVFGYLKFFILIKVKFFRQLTAIGVKGTLPDGGYYFMPDFECLKKGLMKANISNGIEMCDDMLEKAQVAVSFLLLLNMEFLKILISFFFLNCGNYTDNFGAFID